ncbi:MAG: helix-turn-helix transcriptional regulator [Dehalococcoidales bacterium]|nr:helix-turn-helix transcriptional regulator [Dehalococcoidales bacterium]
MIIKTRIFELCGRRYANLSELALAMGLSVSQVYRVREGKRSINQKFIIGAKRAFPECSLDELFYLDNNGDCPPERKPIVTSRYLHIVRQYSKVG